MVPSLGVGSRCALLCLIVCLEVQGFWQHGYQQLAQKDATLEYHSCAEITPGMCALNVVRDQITIRGLNLTYWVYSSQTPFTGSAPALIVVGGGPGMSHAYLTPLTQQACESGRSIILYDQVGCGESSRPLHIAQSAPWLLEVDYYASELQALVSHLGLSSYHLLGHSWGGVVAMMFAASQPRGLIGLVLASAFSDTQLAFRSLHTTLLPTLPPFVVQQLVALDTAQRYTDPEYQAIVQSANAMWFMRTVPPPLCAVQSLSDVNTEISLSMLGQSDINAGGVLANWNGTSQLSRIGQPTLVIGGVYDTITLPVLELLRDEIPRSRLVRAARAGHLGMIDDSGEFNSEIRAFMRAVEAGTFRTDPASPYDPRVAIKNLQIILAGSLIVLVLGLVALRRRFNNLRFISLASRDATNHPSI